LAWSILLQLSTGANLTFHPFLPSLIIKYHAAALTASFASQKYTPEAKKQAKYLIPKQHF